MKTIRSLTEIKAELLGIADSMKKTGWVYDQSIIGVETYSDESLFGKCGCFLGFAAVRENVERSRDFPRVIQGTYQFEEEAELYAILYALYNKTNECGFFAACESLLGIPFSDKLRERLSHVQRND